MNIFRLFESKKFMKICTTTLQIAPFKKKFWRGSMPTNPPSKSLATPRVASPPPPQKSCPPPLANPAYAHALNISVTLYQMYKQMYRQRT